MRNLGVIRSQWVSILICTLLAAIIGITAFSSSDNFPLLDRHRSIILIGAILAFAVLSMWIYVRIRYILPLRRLLDDVQSVRYAKRLVPIQTTRHDEIGRLTNEINRLIAAWNNARKSIEKVQARWEKKFSDRTQQLRSALRRLEKTAHTDPLSGLANRKHFKEYLRYLFDYCSENNSDLACMMIDLDNFKSLNDRFGHSTGDEVIAFVGDILRASIRHCDLAGRYGGDEFVLLLPETSEQQALVIAERIRLMFAREAARFTSSAQLASDPDFNDPRESSFALAINLSIGIATLRKNQPQDSEQLLQLADQALYRVKHNGRNAVAVC